MADSNFIILPLYSKKVKKRLHKTALCRVGVQYNLDREIKRYEE